jgi:UDP-N-acetylmuramoylalanine--D-glutamate ligase
MATNLHKTPEDFTGRRVTIMGLGLNGGGLASTLFFARRGAEVTVTDLRTEEVLGPSLEALAGLPVRYVLGRHEEADFRNADIVVKNPAVRVGNPFVALARRVETDLSLFLSSLDNPVLAVTGSKGKSTTATALHRILVSVDPRARIGGNITVSPLTFLEDLEPGAPVVLELSSWQLADLKGRGLLRPRVSAVTNLLWDHMNSYPDQGAYAGDKAVVFEAQDPATWTLLPVEEPWGPWFADRTPGRRAWIGPGPLTSLPDEGARFSVADGRGQWLDGDGVLREAILLPGALQVPGAPFRRNCLAAGALAVLAGVDPAAVAPALAAFPGVEHRLERFAVRSGVAFYNDTTATIPEAAAASVTSFDVPVHWIAGGTDKSLEFSAFERMGKAPASIVLLRGTATERMVPIFRAKGWSWDGPFDTLDEAVARAVSRARPGEVVVFSPGATSFELFKNEFYRGNAFKDLVLALPGEAP